MRKSESTVLSCTYKTAPHPRTIRHDSSTAQLQATASMKTTPSPPHPTLYTPTLWSSPRDRRQLYPGMSDATLLGPDHHRVHAAISSKTRARVEYPRPYVEHTWASPLSPAGPCPEPHLHSTHFHQKESTPVRAERQLSDHSATRPRSPAPGHANSEPLVTSSRMT